jgi:hypothetical protein
MTKAILGLVQLWTYMRSSKRGEARLWIRPMLTPLLDALGAIVSPALLPIARRQVKPMGHLPGMHGMGLALLGRGPHLMAR